MRKIGDFFGASDVVVSFGVLGSIQNQSVFDTFDFAWTLGSFAEGLDG